MNTDWPFPDHRATACFTTKLVLDGAPILRVYHDYDGDWQFHGVANQPPTTQLAKLVSLESMIDLDSTLKELHDLPYGWLAERDGVGDEWRKQKNNPLPSFSEDGYYLEDAVWLSEFLADINPPKDAVRESLSPGQYVKIVFRFAEENLRADVGSN